MAEEPICDMVVAAMRILDARRVMAISTVRPDGWPQVTLVGYANIGLLIFFLIFRSSQKYANINHDNRIAIAVGEEPGDLSSLQAVYSSAHASEVTDTAEREQAWRLLTERHPNLGGFELPDPTETALMRARCEQLSVLDQTRGWGTSHHFVGHMT